MDFLDTPLTSVNTFKVIDWEQERKPNSQHVALTASAVKVPRKTVGT